MKKHLTLKNIAAAVLALLAIYFMWSLRPQRIDTVMDGWKNVTRASAADMDISAEGKMRELAEDELAQLKEIVEAATFSNRSYKGNIMYGSLYGIYLFKDDTMNIDESLSMRMFPSDEGYIYIGNYRYDYDKHEELWAFMESLDLE